MRRTIVLLTTMAMIKNLSHLRVVLAAAAAGVLAALGMLVLAAEDPAEATFPGKNGKIAWVSGGPNYVHIYTMNADGTGLDRVTAGARSDKNPAWSPDGKKIAFESDRNAGKLEIFTMNADGTGVVRLTKDTARDERTRYLDPAWSPDGKKIVFTSSRDAAWTSGYGNYAIYTMNADGTGVVRLTSNSNTQYNYSNPDWSPDGKKIAFESRRAPGPSGISNLEIHTMNANSTNVVSPTNLTNNPAVDIEPSWSPDSNKIAFVSSRAGGNHDIYTMNANGTCLVRLTKNPLRDYNPAWSPDGKKIAFESPRHHYRSEIYTMNANGPAGLVRFTNNTQGDYQPAWQRLSGLPPPPSYGQCPPQGTGSKR